MNDKKSSSITVLAWLGIALFSCCIVTFVGQLTLLTAAFPKSEMMRAANDAVRKGDYFSSWVFANANSILLASSLLAMMLLGVFIGILQRKNWARLMLLGSSAALSAASLWAICESHMFLRNHALQFQVGFDLFFGFIVVGSLLVIKILVDARYEFSSMSESGKVN